MNPIKKGRNYSGLSLLDSLEGFILLYNQFFMSNSSRTLLKTA